MSFFGASLPVQNQWRAQLTSSANSTIITTVAAVSGQRHYVTHVSVSFQDAVPTAPGPGLALIEDTTGILLWNVAAPLVINFWPPVVIAENKPVKLQLNAGGASVVGKINMLGFTR